MIAAAVIAGIVALVGAFVGGYYLGHSGAAAAVATAAAVDEQKANTAAQAAKEKIEADEKVAVAAVPTETSTELAGVLWGGVLDVKKTEPPK
jgi:hypothetical protein